MTKENIIIYGLIFAGAIFFSLLRKKKKPQSGANSGQRKMLNNQPTNYQQPQKKPATTQPKTLEEILQSLLNEQAPTKQVQQPVKKHLVETDNQPDEFTTPEDTKTLEKQEEKYYNYDEELGYNQEIVDYDETADHHVHGPGFDDALTTVEVEEKSEWEDMDWRKAVIMTEILKRPEY